MTPQADVMDLSLCRDDAHAAKTVCERAKDWAEMIVAINPGADITSVRLLLGEFMKNTLHGDAAIVRMLPLTDGSFLIFSEDDMGTDHIPNDCNGHCGELIIKTLAGDENYRLFLSHDGHYTGYLRIIPRELQAS